MFTTNFNRLIEINGGYLMTGLKTAIRLNSYASDSTITATRENSANRITLTIDETTNFTIEYSEYAATLYDWNDCPVLLGTVEPNGIDFEEVFATKVICTMERLA